MLQIVLLVEAFLDNFVRPVIHLFLVDVATGELSFLLLLLILLSCLPLHILDLFVLLEVVVGWVFVEPVIVLVGDEGWWSLDSIEHFHVRHDPCLLNLESLIVSLTIDYVGDHLRL